MRTRLGIVILLAVGGAVFAVFPARIIECDAVMFSYGALHGDLVFTGYSHHLGYNYLQLAASRLTPLFDPPLSPIWMLQYLSMAAGLAGVYFLYRLIRRIGVGADRALLYSGALLLSYGYWHYSRQADVHVLSGAMLVLFACLFYDFLEQPSRSRAAVLGAVLGLATFMHQSNILMVPAVAVACFVSSRRGVDALRPLKFFGVVYFLIGILPYPLIARYAVGIRTVSELRYWLTSTEEWGGWGAVRSSTVPATVIGLTRTFTGSHYLLGFKPVAALANRVFPLGSFQDEMAVAVWAPGWLRVALIPLHALVLVFTAKALLSAPRRLRQMIRHKSAFAAFIAAWLAILGMFFAWWSPERVDFWIAWLPALFVVLAYPGKKETHARVPRMLAMLAFLAGIFIVNFFGSIYPQSGPVSELDTEAAVTIEAVVKTRDIVISDCSFAGRASVFAKSFDRFNLVETVLGCPPPSDATVYAYRDGRSWEADFEIDAADTVPGAEHEARTLCAVDSLVRVGITEGRGVYLLVSPISTNAARKRTYSALIDLIGNNYDLSETVPLRGDLDMRRIRIAVRKD
jgi:hypothetical protein